MDATTSQTSEEARLYSAAQIGMATFLGAPIAGALLMRKNFLTLGHASAARQTLMTGFFVTGLLFLVAFWLPETFPNQILPLASVLSMNAWYKAVQGNAFKTHVEAKGATGSWGIAVGIGFLSLLIISSVLFGLIMILPDSLFE